MDEDGFVSLVIVSPIIIFAVLFLGRWLFEEVKYRRGRRLTVGNGQYIGKFNSKFHPGFVGDTTTVTISLGVMRISMVLTAADLVRLAGSLLSGRGNNVYLPMTVSCPPLKPQEEYFVLTEQSLKMERSA